jgi:hypothetical protein
MRAFKEFMVFTIFSCTFASIVWYISFPFAVEVLSTSSLVHFATVAFGRRFERDYQWMNLLTQILA